MCKSSTGSGSINFNPITVVNFHFSEEPVARIMSSVAV